MKIFVVNPGSTSTKVACFEDERRLFAKTVDHSSEELAKLKTLEDQLPYRMDTINAALAEAGVSIDDCDAFVGRGGGLLPMLGGVYKITDTVLDHSIHSANGVVHPASLGPTLAYMLAGRGDKPAFVVNPPDTDELCDLARVTGVNSVYRHVHLHALNLKETAIRHAASLGKRYEDCNFVVCHIGGGISISAHKAGRMIDGNDIVGGEGPMAPTRSGSVPVVEILNYLDAGHSVADVRRLCMKSGGFVDLLGTSDAIEVCDRAAAGDAAAQRTWDAMLYQISKWIGAMACALEGKVDGILLGGGMVHSKELVAAIEKSCSWIAPVTAYPGEFELEAMAAGARRVLAGQEEALEYSGCPVWEGFAD